MPVQMIELEEVVMMGVSDEYLEALRSPLDMSTTAAHTTCDGDVTDGCPW
jgi:hypothetical protein